MSEHHLRLPPALHERLKAIADEQDMSLNAAIVLVLASATTGVDFTPNPTSYQSPGVSAEVKSIIGRMHWQSAKTVDHVAGGQHEYCVRGWDRDDVSEQEFQLVVQAIKLHGRREEWHAPESFYTSGKRPKMKNNYLYVDEFAIWFTWPKGSVPMLNREAVSQQLKTPTRTVLAP